MKNKIDLSKLLKDKQIIFFGDDHNMNQGREWLREEIKKNKQKIDFVALEYFETSKQQLIEGGDDKRMQKYLEKTYKDFCGFKAKSVIEIVKVCKELGVKVFGIEMPEESFSDWYKAESQAERIKDIAKQIIGLSELGNGVVLIGADHVEKGKDNVFKLVRQTLDEAKLASVVFIGGKDWTIDTEEYWVRKLEIEAQRNKQHKKFYVKPGDKKFLADWIIHFPQTEHC